MSKKYNINYGTDPEFFLSYRGDADYDKFVGDNFVYSPALLLMQGVKPVVNDFKHPVMVRGEDYGIVMDGVAMEINFKRPFQSIISMVGYVRMALDALSEYAKAFGLDVCMTPTINFDYKKWVTDTNMANDVFYQGVIFGCDPDKDAFNTKWEAYILQSETHPLRYGGGHVHLSGIETFKVNPIQSIRSMAYTLGLFTTAHSPYPDMERLRAMYYGKPGKYRVQKYKSGDIGIEYRTPSNSWCSYSDDLLMELEEVIAKGIYIVENPKVFTKVEKLYKKDICEAISTANQDMAKDLLEKVMVI